MAKRKNKKEEGRKTFAEILAEERAKRSDVTQQARPLEKREIRRRFLIVCEGENTEPSYFNAFKVRSATVKAVGKGYNTISLVNEAIRLRGEGAYDEVWCVFDKDEFSSQNFNGAIQLAADNGLAAGYSNQAFEYWLILHFEDHQGGGMRREDYNAKLNSYLTTFNLSYDGNGDKLVPEAFFDVSQELIGKGREQKTRMQVAIDRAEKIYERKKTEGGTPADWESVTTVFKLVRELSKYIDSEANR